MPSEFASISSFLCGMGLLAYAALSLAAGKIHFRGSEPDRWKQPYDFWFAWSLHAIIGASLLAYFAWSLYLDVLR